jgi:hypothetical protein
MPLAKSPAAMIPPGVLPRITAVEPWNGSRLRLTFTDGLIREVDLSGDLWGPMAEPLQDPAYFAKVRVDPGLGTVVWPNGYDLDPDVLHGDFEPAARLISRYRKRKPGYPGRLPGQWDTGSTRARAMIKVSAKQWLRAATARQSAASNQEAP